MLRKELLFFSAVLLIGFLDWLTTVTGILFCGATEANPIMAGLTTSSIALFSAVKLAAVSLAGFAFYKATVMIRPTADKHHSTNAFLNVGCSMTILIFALVVANNVITILWL